MDSLTDPDVVRVVIMKSSQVGGTEVANNWIGHTIDADPAPMLILFPTDDTVKLWSTVKLDAMLRSSDTLRGKVVDADKRRDKRNTMRRKIFYGGSLVALSAKSSAQLRSLTAPRAIADEVDEYDPDVNRQGDPLELLERAMRTFILTGLAKLLVISTPTFEVGSRILQEYRKTDQRSFHLSCPACNGWQPLVWQDEAGRYRFLFERDTDGRVALGSTVYACAFCPRKIEQQWRSPMLDGGRWVPAGARRGDRVEACHYDVSELQGLGLRLMRPPSRSAYSANSAANSVSLRSSRSDPLVKGA